MLGANFGAATRRLTATITTLFVMTNLKNCRMKIYARSVKERLAYFWTNLVSCYCEFVRDKRTYEQWENEQW